MAEGYLIEGYYEERMNAEEFDNASRPLTDKQLAAIFDLLEPQTPDRARQLPAVRNLVKVLSQSLDPHWIDGYVSTCLFHHFYREFIHIPYALSGVLRVKVNGTTQKPERHETLRFFRTRM